MKLFRFAALALLVTGLTFLNSCKSDDSEDPSVQEEKFKLMAKGDNAGVWVIDEVTFGTGNDRTTEYGTMTLTINDDFDKTDNTFTYDMTNKPADPTLTPWPKTGTWKFDEGNPGFIVIRNPGSEDLVVTYTVTENFLQVQFTYDGPGLGQNERISQVKGDWIFKFVPAN